MQRLSHGQVASFLSAVTDGLGPTAEILIPSYLMYKFLTLTYGLSLTKTQLSDLIVRSKMSWWVMLGTNLDFSLTNHPALADPRRSYSRVSCQTPNVQLTGPKLKLLNS